MGLYCGSTHEFVAGFRYRIPCSERNIANISLFSQDIQIPLQAKANADIGDHSLASATPARK